MLNFLPASNVYCDHQQVNYLFPPACVYKETSVQLFLGNHLGFKGQRIQRIETCTCTLFVNMSHTASCESGPGCLKNAATFTVNNQNLKPILRLESPSVYTRYHTCVFKTISTLSCVASCLNRGEM